MRKSVGVIPDEEMNKLIQYHWPGNVRELENIIERGIILSSGNRFRVPALAVVPQQPAHVGINDTLDENERRHILWAMSKTEWKVRGPGGAAELLDIHPSTLTFRMRKLGLMRGPHGQPFGTLCCEFGSQLSDRVDRLLNVICKQLRATGL